MRRQSLNSVYQQKLCQRPLGKPRAMVRSFNNQPITVHDIFKTKFVQGRVHQNYVHVVPDGYSSVLGRIFLKPLRALVDCYSSTVKDGASQDRQSPKAVKSISSTTDYKKEFLEKHIPNLMKQEIARRDASDKEIQETVDQGICKKVERSSWIHSMVTVPKPDEGIRVTTYPSPLKPAVVPQRHPIPSIPSDPRNIQREGMSPQLNHMEKKPVVRPLSKKGEKVLIKLPRVRKGTPPYSKPMTVVKVLGYYNYVLSDGWKHNAQRIKPWREPDDDETLEVRPQQIPQQRSGGPARVQRRESPPNAMIPCNQAGRGC